MPDEPLDLQPVEKPPLDLQPVVEEPLDLQPWPARPEVSLRAATPEPWLRKAGRALRESLTPLIGPTREQVLREGIPVYDKTGNLVDIQFRPLGGKLESEGLFPALAHPMVPLPSAPEMSAIEARSPRLANTIRAAIIAKGALSPAGMPVTKEDIDKQYARGAALYNTAKGFAEFVESPLGLATAGAGGLGSAVVNRTLAGGYAADIARHVPEAAEQAGTLSVTGTPQQRYEANLGLAVTTALPGPLGKTALRPKRPIPPIIPRQAPDARRQTPDASVSEFGGDRVQEPLDVQPVKDSGTGEAEPQPPGAPQPPIQPAPVSPTGAASKKGVTDATQEGEQPSNVPAQSQGGDRGGQAPSPSPGDRLQPTAPQPPGQPTPPAALTPGSAGVPPASEPPPTVTVLADRRLYPVVEVPVAELSLSKDVPNFKAEADIETGVVAGQQLEGTYERLGTGAITVWERTDGRREVISGRHRFDLARRAGEATIPAQIVREVDGFTRDMAMTLDAEMNIRDGQGSVSDYANYLRNIPITEAEARSRGLLSRAKGRAGWSLAKAASDDLYALYAAGKISEGQAVAISEAAPGEPALQRVGSQQALKGAAPQELHNFLQAVRYKTKSLPAEQLDLFGADDAAMTQAAALGRIATELQRQLDKEIKATDNAARNAEAARAKGIRFERSPEDLLRENAGLRVRRNEWNSWALKPELVAQVLEKAGLKDVGPSATLELRESPSADVRGREQPGGAGERQPAPEGKPAGETAALGGTAGALQRIAAATQAQAELMVALPRRENGVDWRALTSEQITRIFDHESARLDAWRDYFREIDKSGVAYPPHAKFALEQADAQKGRIQNLLHWLISSGSAHPDIVKAKAELQGRLIEFRGFIDQLEQDVRATGGNVDVIESFLKRAIDATDPLKGGLLEGITGAPVWLSKAAAYTALQVVLAAYRAGKQLAAAIEEGVAWLRAQNVEGFNAEVARDWLAGAVNVRQFGEKFHDDAGLSPQVRAGVTEYFYTHRPHADLKAVASQFVQDHGLDNALAAYHDGRALLPDERVALGAELEKRLAGEERRQRAQGNTIEADALVQQQIDLADAAMIASTETAQALAAHHLYGRMSPGAVLAHTQRTFDEAAGTQWTNAKPDIDNFKRDVLQQGNADALQGTIADPAVNATAKTAVDQTVATSEQTRKAVILELTEEWSQVPSVVEAARAQVRAKAEQLLNTQPRPPGLTAPEFLRGILDDLAARAATIAAGHYQGAEPGVVLKDKFVQRLGLSEDAALRLARAMDREFERQVKAAEAKLPKRIANQRARQTRDVQAARAEQATEEQIIKARSVISRERQSTAQSIAASFAQRGKAKSAGAIAEFYQRLTANIRGQLERTLPKKAEGETPAKITDLQALTEMLEHPERYQEALDQTHHELRQAFKDKPAELAELQKFLDMDAVELNEGRVDRILRAQLRELNMTLGDVVRRSAAEVDAAGRTIGERVVAASGLKGDAAAKLQAAFDRRFAAAAAERKRALLAQWEARGNRLPRKVRSAFDQLAELTNLGAFDDAKFDRAVQQRLGLPTLTPELKAEIVRRANAVQALPEDSLQRQRAGIELMNFIERQKGLPVSSKLWAFYLTNILSGLTTHAINVLSTGTNAVYHLGLLAALNPRSLPQIVAALGRGIPKGALDAMAVLRTGIVTGSRSPKIEAGRVLEQWDPQLSKLHPFRLWKYNFRLMAAEDLLLFKPIEEARTAVLARAVARREGLTGPALQQRMADINGDLDGRIAAARRQAQSEGLTGLDYQRRWREIIEQARPAELREDARQYALRVTFNNQPYGLLGSIAQAFNLARAKHPSLNLVQPFVNTVANVFNEQLNNHPLSGTWRAARSLQTGEIYGQRLSSDRQELHEQYAKAVLATAGLSALAAYFGRNDGDPDKPQIHGGGPRTKAQRDQLRETGWLPYSLQFGNRFVPYEAAPSAFGLAVLGDYLDAGRYRNLDQTDALNRASVALRLHGRIIAKQSFISGLYNLVEWLGADNTKTAGDKFAQSLARAGSSVIVPNLARQVDRLFDPTVYEPTGMFAAVAAQTPFVRREGRPALNVLGEPVEKYLSERFWSKREPDALWDAIARQNAWIPMPDREQIVGDKRRGPDYYRILTDEEYYEFIQESGARIRDRLDPDRIMALEPEQAKLYVQKVAAAEHERVKKLFR